jgi:hypothetical protein
LTFLQPTHSPQLLCIILTSLCRSTQCFHAKQEFDSSSTSHPSSVIRTSHILHI